MKSKIIQKKTLLSLLAVIGMSLVIIIVLLGALKTNTTALTEATEIKSVASVIQADGAITPQNQATLHFQLGGKLTYLPFKEGDLVRQGQTIASLDTYVLQRQVQLAANAFKTAQNSNSQVQQNVGAGVVEGQQRISLDTTNHNSYANTPEAQVITDQVQRIVNNSLLAQNSAQLNVDLANYAIQLATLTSPLDGVVTHEDVILPGVNVTPATSFTVADPSSLVFRANILENDIDFISVGGTATIKVGNDLAKPIIGTVSKIYPDKITLPSGQKAYQVDIESVQISNNSYKMGVSGVVLIRSNTTTNVKLVPTWTVLDHDSLWVLSDGKPVLKSVKLGKIHGDMTEVIEGLSENDKVIINPESIASEKYRIL